MLERGGKVGDYTLVKFLGRGQFGVVWLAEKEIAFSKKRFRHALKFLPQGADEASLKLIQAEIDTWIEASGHPNVMSVLDMMLYDHHIVIASEFADGGSLMDWLRKSDGKAPSHEKALEMMTGILSGIEHLHSRNVIHRDLKPDNILLQGKTPRITDFGISRIVSAGSMSAVAMGSPFYMSPESFDGGKTRQTDIWSAGVILYEMLTGEHPYRSDSIYGLVSAIREDEPKPLPPSVPVELRTIVETALQKNLALRYRSANEMRHVVEQEILNLKTRHRRDIRANRTGEGFVDPTAITLFDAKIDLSELEILPAAGKDTAPSMPVNKPTPATQEVPGSSSADSLEIETKRAIPPPPMVMPVGQSTADNLRSQFDGWKRPVLIAGGVGGVVIIGLVVGLISFFAAARSIIVSVQETTTESAPANTATAKPDASEPKAPDGMVYVPGGEFKMGRNDGIKEENPEHKAAVAPFFIDIYEVTNEEYARFVKAMNHGRPPGWKRGTYRDGEARFPVVGVNWKDAEAYANWTGKRLPTEEEWEFAARGADGFLYPWGNEWKSDLANADGASRTFTQVGAFPGTSPFGIYDMVGNAGEWTSTDFKAYPGGELPGDYAGKKNLKTVRGSSFDLSREYSTATYRFGYAVTGEDSYEFTGFRCARDVGK